MRLGNCHFATDKNTFYIQEIAKGDFRLYNRRFKSAKVETSFLLENYLFISII